MHAQKHTIKKLSPQQEQGRSSKILQTLQLLEHSKINHVKCLHQ